MKPKFLALIGNAHRCSGLSLRELALCVTWIHPMVRVLYRANVGQAEMLLSSCVHLVGKSAGKRQTKY